MGVGVALAVVVVAVAKFFSAKSPCTCVHAGGRGTLHLAVSIDDNDQYSRSSCILS